MHTVVRSERTDRKYTSRHGVPADEADGDATTAPEPAAGHEAGVVGIGVAGAETEAAVIGFASGW